MLMQTRVSLNRYLVYLWSIVASVGLTHFALTIQRFRIAETFDVSTEHA